MTILILACSPRMRCYVGGAWVSTSFHFQKGIALPTIHCRGSIEKVVHPCPCRGRAGAGLRARIESISAIARAVVTWRTRATRPSEDVHLRLDFASASAVKEGENATIPCLTGASAWDLRASRFEFPGIRESGLELSPGVRMG